MAKPFDEPPGALTVYLERAGGVLGFGGPGRAQRPEGGESGAD